MKGPLSKSQLCWVVLRVIGLVFAFWGINLIVSLGAHLLLYGSGIVNSATLNLTGLFQGIVWLVLGFYFLRRGQGAHNLLMYVHSVPQDLPVLKKAPIDPETGLSGNELVKFKEWRLIHLKTINLPIEDQVARFRDFQAGR